eukprot:12917029-Prorocentrum_lima.AAC.1
MAMPSASAAETLLAVNYQNNPVEQQRFYSLMESFYGTEWQARNTLKQVLVDDWGGQWICRTCNKFPHGDDQLIAHVLSDKHMKW